MFKVEVFELQMGSEQSSQSARSQSVKSTTKVKEPQNVRCSSPRPSISSDSDIPYISYTVNRPIGGNFTLPLQKIPTFHPIMRGALNIPTIQDQEILDKLDHQCILNLCQRYQEHLKLCAEIVSAEQNVLTQRIREIDFAITTLTNVLTERQKKFVKHAEQIGKVQEISNNLQRCQTTLKDIIDDMEKLNNILPPEERLEPFVMVTG
ncbi:BLOC-1-related complex subunit 5 [Parasteatoda tepidariorum]|uniref:BLOC-1-related complex subunit 5 n=1 Tax=Parasteatoda tepidariorum TaxID=114398 RepID=UPI0039BD16D3